MGFHGNETQVYVYLTLTFLLSLGITWRSQVRQKVVLLVYGFFYMSGTVRMILTFKIPGVSFFEIQPDRFIFIFSTFYLLILLRRRSNREMLKERWVAPPFEWALYAYVAFILMAITYHFTHIGFREYVLLVSKNLNFVAIYLLLKIVMDKKFFVGIGRMLLVGALLSAVISLIQFGIDPFFMRYDEMRPAFGSFIRSNGSFANEYSNSYFMIAGICWALFTIKPIHWRVLIVGILCAGVITTFHRMSWLILIMILTINFVWLQRQRVDWLALGGLTLATLFLAVGLFFSREIMTSSLVKDRLSEGVDSRFGYYAMVYENIGAKPLFGYGDKNNDVYYKSMLEITGQLARATGDQGSIHNGYLSNTFYYGIPALFLFVLVFILYLMYTFKHLSVNPIFAIPFLFTIVYMLANLTNSFLFLKVVSSYITLHMGVFTGLLQNRIFTTSDDTIPISQPEAEDLI